MKHWRRLSFGRMELTAFVIGFCFASLRAGCRPVVSTVYRQFNLRVDECHRNYYLSALIRLRFWWLAGGQKSQSSRYFAPSLVAAGALQISWVMLANL